MRSNMFDRVLCINLDRRPENWKAFRERLAALDWPHAPVERFAAFDGWANDPPAGWNAAPGRWGCCRSHAKLLREALDDNLANVLVFEDDAIFAPNFLEHFRSFLRELPADWDQFYLGGVKNGPVTEVSDHVLRTFGTMYTHAYGMNRKFMEPMLRHIVDNEGRDGVWDIDVRMAQLHALDRYRIYRPRRWIVTQDKSVSDTAHRPDVA